MVTKAVWLPRAGPEAALMSAWTACAVCMACQGSTLRRLVQRHWTLEGGGEHASPIGAAPLEGGGNADPLPSLCVCLSLSLSVSLSPSLSLCLSVSLSLSVRVSLSLVLSRSLSLSPLQAVVSADPKVVPHAVYVDVTPLQPPRFPFPNLESSPCMQQPAHAHTRMHARARTHARTRTEQGYFASVFFVFLGGVQDNTGQ